MENETETPVESTTIPMSVTFNRPNTISLTNDRQEITPEFRQGGTTGCQKRETGLSQGEILRYPFLVAIEHCVHTIWSLQKPTTVTHKVRILRHIAVYIEQLKTDGKIKNTNPKLMDEQDCIAVIKWLKEYRTMKGAPLDPNTQSMWIGYINEVLKAHGNSALDVVKMMHKQVMPRRTEKPIFVKNKDELKVLFDGASKITGWSGAVARFLLVIIVGCGIRIQELRPAYLEDLSLKSDGIDMFVRFPKGQGTWGQQRTTAVNPRFRSAILEYLGQREAYLNGKNTPLLIPYMYRDGRVTEWSPAFLCQLSGELRRISGVDFNWRGLRPTYANILINEYNVSISDGAKMLGHKYTKTTEQYYARVHEAKAIERVKRAYAETEHPDGVFDLPSVE